MKEHLRHELPPIAAIIVLANLMDTDGTLNSESRSRIDLACDAYHNGDAPLLVTCGWAYRSDSNLTIAEAMRRYAIVHREIPAESIVVEENSRDTVGDACFTKWNHAIPRAWRNILIVTSRYHTSRTERIFEFIYGPGYNIQVRGSDSIDNESIQSIERQSLGAFYRTFEGVTAGDDDLIVQRLVTRHPFYNGEMHPRIDGPLIPATLSSANAQ